MPAVIRTNRNAFIVAFIIAYRSRWNSEFNPLGLPMGWAAIDYETWGLTRQEFRTARQILEKFNFATFSSTKAGTVGKLNDTRLFEVVTTDDNNQQPNQMPTNRPTNVQPSEQPLTKNREHKNKEKGDNEPPSEMADWKLEKDEERIRLQIDRLTNASKPDPELLEAKRARLSALKAEAKSRGLKLKGQSNRNEWTANEGKASEYANYQPRNGSPSAPDASTAPTPPEGRRPEELSVEEWKTYCEQLKAAIDGDEPGELPPDIE